MIDDDEDEARADNQQDKLGNIPDKQEVEEEEENDILPSARNKKKKLPISINEARRTTHDPNTMNRTIDQMKAPQDRLRIKGLDLFKNQQKRPSFFVCKDRIKELPGKENSVSNQNKDSSSEPDTFSDSSSEESNLSFEND